MDGNARFVFPAVMVFMVTLTVTAINLGIHHDFLWQWARAYVIAWPVAGTTAFFPMPIARRGCGGQAGPRASFPQKLKMRLLQS